MPKGQIFPYLSPEALSGLRWIGVPIHIFCFSTNRVCWSNESSLAFWNAGSVEELLARTLTPFSDATAQRLAEYRAAFSRGEERNEGWTFYPKGEPTTTQCRCTGVSLDGHPEAMLVEIRVLTPHELPVAELRSIEALRHTPLMISLFSATGEILLRNPAAASCFKLLDEALAPGADHLEPMFADREYGRTLIARARAEGKVQGSAVMTIPGSPVHSIELLLVADPATGSDALLVAQQDISETVAARRQLAASEEALDLILGLHDSAVLVFSVCDGSILQANGVAGRLLGIRPDTNEPVERLFADSADLTAITATLLSGQGSNWQVRLRRADAGTFWASVSGLRISFHDIDAIVLIATDNDSFYRAASELEDALDFERRTTDMQRRVLAIASHEFRTPLAIVDSTAQRLERRAETGTADEIRTATRRIRSTVNQLIRMIDATLDHARLELGGYAFNPVLTDIGALIADSCAKFREHHAGLKIELAIPALPHLLLDRALIERAFENLLSNAVKYSDGAGSVVVTGAASSEDVRVTIRDHGIGVPPEDRVRVFSQFYRAANVGDRRGSGLGLSIVRQIIDMHGGQIEVVDTQGEGTTIQINLPRPTGQAPRSTNLALESR